MLRFSRQQAKWKTLLNYKRSLNTETPRIIYFDDRRFSFQPLTSYAAFYFHQVKFIVQLRNCSQQEHERTFKAKNISTQETKESHERSTKNLALILMGMGILAYHSLQLYRWWTVPQPFDQFQGSQPMTLPLNQPYLKDLDIDVDDPKTCFLTKDFPSLLRESHNIVTVVSGEPGIGKTTAFKSFVDQRRAKKLPSLYFAITSEDTLHSMLLSCFKTADKKLILDKLREFCMKGKPPVLVIDDIQRCFDPKMRQFTLGLLEFCQTFRENGGKIFLLSSDSSVAYEITSSSGYKFRSGVFELQSRSKDTIKKFLRNELNLTKKNPLSENDINEYWELFGGNMSILSSFYDQKDISFEDFVKEQEALVLQTMNNLKYKYANSVGLMRKLMVEKSVDFSNWIDLSALDVPPDIDSSIQVFIKKDILTKRGMNEFRFKNKLTRNVIISRLNDDKEDQNQFKLQSSSSKVSAKIDEISKV